MTDYDRFLQSSPENRRRLRQEELMLRMGEALCEAMKARGISKEELARRLNKALIYIDQLRGGSIVSLRAYADVFDALNMMPVIVLGSRAVPSGNVGSGPDEFDLSEHDPQGT